MKDNHVHTPLFVCCQGNDFDRHGSKGESTTGNQDYFKDLLKKEGFKVTTQRVVILEVFIGHPGRHFTVEEIYDCVKENYSEIGLATVYRTIQLLSELSVIDKLSLDDG